MNADGLRDELQAIMQGSITTGNGVDRVMAVLQRHIDAACEQERNYRSGDEIALAQVKVRDQLGQLRLERDAAVARAEAAEAAIERVRALIREAETRDQDGWPVVDTAELSVALDGPLDGTP